MRMIEKAQKLFNMVEITLAIAVIGIGIAGVMSLFPVAISASRDSVGDNYSADIAEQFVSFISMKYLDTWPSTPLALTKDILTDTSPDPVDFFGTTRTPMAGNIYASIGPNEQVFLVRQESGGITDFTAAVRIWTTQITDMWMANVTRTVPPDYGIRLNIEISWPVEKPHAKRTKRYYCQELFNWNK